MFSEIIKNLPQEKRVKMDSLKNAGPVTVHKDADDSVAPEDRKKNLDEKRKREVDALSQDVKERVEKAILDLEQRKKERQLEFKVIENK